MAAVFYTAGVVSIVATLLAISARSVVHGLLYLVVSLLDSAVIFYALGAPFASAVEVILYAGAVMVLFLFAVMLIGQREPQRKRQRTWLHPRAWVGPAGLGLLLIVEMIILLRRGGAPSGAQRVPPERVAEALYGPYVVGVEAISMLLFSGLLGVFRLGRTASEEKRAP